MNMKFYMGLVVALAASAAFSKTTIEGITAPNGFTMSKKGLGDEASGGIGKFPEGFTINSIEDALFAATNRGFVVWGEESFPSVQKDIVAGYIGDQSGFFDYGKKEDSAEEYSGYPSGRWSQNEASLFGAKGVIHVPSAGVWTLGVGARDGSFVSLSVKGNGVNYYKTHTSTSGSENEVLLAAIDFQVDGDYEIEIYQYFPPNGAWLELAAAKGDMSSFTTFVYDYVEVFRLIGDPLTTYTVSFGYTDEDLGDISLGSQEVKERRLLTRPEDPRRAGYAFVDWRLDGQIYDFDTPVADDMELVATWIPNNAPVIDRVGYTPTWPTIEGVSADVTLSVVAFDQDAGRDVLTYKWASVTAPGGCSFDEVTNSTVTATVSGPGEYVFSVTVSDGHEDVSTNVSVKVRMSANATAFAFVGYERAGDPIGHQGTLQDPDIAEYPWSITNAGYKAAWRSTASGQKNWLLEKPKDRPNAYGLDGYVFPGTCLRTNETDGAFTVNTVTSGTVADNPNIISNVTDYIKSIEFLNGTMVDQAGIYWIDDPVLPISEDVKDFKPGAFTVAVPKTAAADEYTVFARITFAYRAARYPKIRIGLLSGYGDHFKPSHAKVGVTAPWAYNGDDGYGQLTWMFFDVDNAKSGSENVVELAIKGMNNFDDGKGNSQCRIEGIVFDSIYKKSGLLVSIR